MRPIELFNHDVNQSDPTRFERWTDYRNQITSFIDDHTDGHVFSHLLVVGAGNCDDLDLSYLMRKFKKITLMDIDLEAMQKGLKTYHLDEKDIELIQKEFTGFDESGFFESLIDDLFQIDDGDKLIEYLNQKVKRALHVPIFKSHHQPYDFILVSPIYTQLVFHQIQNVSEVLHQMNYPLSLIEVLKSTMLDHMTDLIDRFNKELTHQLKSQGKMLVLSDIFQSMKHDVFDEDIRYAIRSTQKMDRFHETYQKTYGFGLGDYGLYSMSEIMHPIYHQWFIWPFEEHLSMTVKAVLYENKG